MIAIVEDNRDLAHTLKNVFEETGGWRARVYTDGEDARHRLPADCPDLIVLDIELPGLDGASLHRMLRAMPETAATPILVTTAHHEWVLQRMGFEPDAIMLKPFDLDELLATVSTLLAKSPSGKAGAE